MKRLIVLRVYAYDSKNKEIGYFRFSAKDYKDGLRQFFEFAEMVFCDECTSICRIDLYCALHRLFSLSDVRRILKQSNI